MSPNSIKRQRIEFIYYRVDFPPIFMLFVSMADEGNDSRNSESNSSASDSDGGYELSPSHASRQSQIQPYQFEPTSHVIDASENPTPHGTPTERRAGNVPWCQCGHCRVMETETESICCKGEVTGEFFDEDCISLNNNFASVFLHREVLKATLGGLNNLRGDRMNIETRSLRYAAYRLFTWWASADLGKN